MSFIILFFIRILSIVFWLLPSKSTLVLIGIISGYLFFNFSNFVKILKSISIKIALLTLLFKIKLKVFEFFSISPAPNSTVFIFLFLNDLLRISSITPSSPFCECKSNLNLWRFLSLSHNFFSILKWKLRGVLLPGAPDPSS